MKETSCDCCPVPIWKVRAIPAAANAESPGWVAVIVQVPALTAVAEPTVVAGSAVRGPATPETVHTAGVSDRNEIGASRVTEALRVTCAPTLVSGCPGWVPSGWPKVTVCWPGPVPVWKARARLGAAANSAFPACEAVIVHTPAATAVATVPESVLATVHTAGVAERNETGSPDDAVACRVTAVPTAVSAAPADVPSGCPNLMVCRAVPAPVPVPAVVVVSQACPARAGPPAGGSGPASVAGPVIPATTQMPRSPHAPRQSPGWPGLVRPGRRLRDRSTMTAPLVLTGRPAGRHFVMDPEAAGAAGDTCPMVSLRWPGGPVSDRGRARST